jgi:hypothetical protein
VGGHSRNVGKTSVVAGLISATREAHWLAIKITQFGHGVCSITTEPCDCALNESEHSWSVDEEFDRSAVSDTSRFLVAGAERVYWARTKQGMLAEAMPRLREIIAGAENVIIESNSVIRSLRPDLYLSVLDFANQDFKDSAREFLDRADAVLVQGSRAESRWDNVSLKLIAGKPQFQIAPPQYVTDEVLEFVRERVFNRAKARVTE